MWLGRELPALPKHGLGLYTLDHKRPLSMWRGLLATTILDLFRGLIWLAAQGLHDPFQTLALFKPC